MLFNLIVITLQQIVEIANGNGASRSGDSSLDTRLCGPFNGSPSWLLLAPQNYRSTRIARLNVGSLITLLEATNDDTNPLSIITQHKQTTIKQWPQEEEEGKKGQDYASQPFFQIECKHTNAIDRLMTGPVVCLRCLRGGKGGRQVIGNTATTQKMVQRNLFLGKPPVQTRIVELLPCDKRAPASQGMFFFGKYHLLHSLAQ